MRHAQLPACTALARACPETTFVLDHAGKPYIRGGVLDPWRQNLAALARLPNVVCKLSGLVTEAEPATWTPAALRPYVEHLLSCFGPGRLLFGSDWPFAEPGLQLEECVRVCGESGVPRDRLESLMLENSRRLWPEAFEA